MVWELRECFREIMSVYGPNQLSTRHGKQLFLLNVPWATILLPMAFLT